MRVFKNHLKPLVFLLPVFMLGACGSDPTELYQAAQEMEKTKNENHYSQEDILNKYTEASEAGSEEASVYLARYYCENKITDKCLKLIPVVAKKNKGLAYYYDATLRLKNATNDSDLDVAISKLLDAEKAGEKRASYPLGEYYLKKHEIHKAMDYFEKAVSDGDSKAGFAIAKIYLDTPDLKKNTRGLALLKAYSEQNPSDSKAALVLARCYIEGLGGPQDLQTAEKILKHFPENSIDADVSFVRAEKRLYTPGKENVDAGIAMLKNLVQVNNNPNAAYLLYNVYSKGLFNLEKSPKDAIYYVRIASDAGMPKGMLALAEMYRDGIGAAQNLDESYRLVEKALETEPELVDAMFIKGKFLSEGIGCTRNSEEAYNYFKRAANFSSEEAEYELALLVIQGLVPNANENEAIAILEKLASHGNNQAAFKYGQALFTGTGVDRDLKKAETYLKQAVNGGVKEAIMPYAAVLDYKDDTENALLWYKVLADDTEPTFERADASARLGEIYDLRDEYEKSEKYYRQAYDSGIISAGINLGRIYYIQGKYPEAATIFNKHAVDNSIAQTFLGLMYENGKGYAPNEIKALEWYDKAIKNNNADAMFLEANLLKTGRNIPEHLVSKADDLFLTAACKENVLSLMYVVNVMYKDAPGISRAWLRYGSENIDNQEIKDLYEKGLPTTENDYRDVAEYCLPRK